MDCEQALALISSRIDREILPSENTWLSEHLRACAPCRAMAEAFALQHEELRETFEPRRAAVVATVDRVNETLTDSRPPRRNPSPRWGWHPLLLPVAVAGALAAVFLIAVAFRWYLSLSVPVAKPPTPPGPFVTPTPPAPPTLAQGDRLTPRSRPKLIEAASLREGEMVTTAAGERRRATLPDGSMVFLNENTSLKVDTAADLRVLSGTAYFELQKKDATPPGGNSVNVGVRDRLVTSDGAKFAIQYEDERNTRLLVAEGEVHVSVPSPAPNDQGVMVRSGELLAPGAKTTTRSARLSHVLDWTRDLVAASETRLVPASNYDGGALIAVDANGQEAKLSLRKYHVDVHVEDGFARTTIDQTYFNHHSWRLEGTFHFPLPPDASLSRLAMYVDGQLNEGGMVERDYGRTVYERIVNGQRDPALLEWVDGSTFKMRVFPLEGRQEKRIVLSYTQRVPTLYGKAQYRFPAGHSLQVVRDWSFHALVKNGANYIAASPSHPAMKRTTRGGDLVLTDAAANCKVDRDVVLDLTDTSFVAEDKDAARFARAELDGNEYLMMRFRPQLPARKKPEKRDWIFLCETSADRDPLLARTQIEIIRGLLNHAERDDTFEILAASNRVTLLPGGFGFGMPGPTYDCTPETVTEAITKLERTHLVGALDLGTAFRVTSLQGNIKNPYLVHVGSGYTGMGTPQEELTKHLPPGVKYIGIGVGKRWNRAFMKQCAEQTGGYYTQINPDESISWRTFDLMATLNTPRLLNVKVDDARQQGDDENFGRFLLDGNAIAQGEELCATIRLAVRDGSTGLRKLSMPKEVRITGLLDGEKFERTVRVANVADKAAYVPRTWAKLEIDRLLADNPRKYKNDIVELSKAMYVMSPFTSLLVLENEAMYKEFKVDRGRKDHWALYPCAEKIPVVYEPDPTMPADVRNAPKGMKPGPNEVLQTVCVRVPPRWLDVRDQSSRERPRFTTGTNLYRERYAVPDDSIRNDFEEFGLSTGRSLSRTLDSGKRSFLLTSAGGFSKKDREDQLIRRLNLNLLDGGLDRDESGLVATSRPIFAPYGSMGFGAELEKSLLWDDAPDGRKRLFSGRADPYFLAGVADPIAAPLPHSPESATPHFRTPNLAPLLGERLMNRTYLFQSMLEAENLYAISNGGSQPLLFGDGGNNPTSRTVHPGSRESLLYQRLRFSRDPRLFTDLLTYAPGLNTSSADLQAVLEAEALPDLRQAPGRIDPDARKLFDATRNANWYALTTDTDRAEPVLLFNGTGSYFYERKPALGLHEIVACNGETVLHVYPDIGLAGERTVTRFHRAEMAELIPWQLPPAEDLARGVDLECVAANTVALVPHWLRDAKITKDETPKHLRLHLVFVDKRLAERQLVEMPAKTIVGREVYDGEGGIRLLDKDNKEVSKLKRTVRPVAAPDLRPDRSTLIVLPLPFRSRAHVMNQVALHPSASLAAPENGCFEYLNNEDCLKLLTALVAEQNAHEARLVYRRCFHPRDDSRRGLFVLLSAAGVDVSAEPGFRQRYAAAPDDALLQYVALCGNKLYRYTQQRFPVHAGATAEREKTFLRELSDAQALLVRWESPTGQRLAWDWRQGDVRRSVAFLRRHERDALGLALLHEMQDWTEGRTTASEQRRCLTLAEEWKRVAEANDGAYRAHYEQACSLYLADQRPEAATVFRDLYAKSLKAKVLPPIDRRFKHALQDLEAKTVVDDWNPLMRDTGRQFNKDGHHAAALALAKQCQRLGEPALADTLIEDVLAAIKDKPDAWPTTLAVVEYRMDAGEVTRADELLQPLLTNKKLAQVPGLWRLAGRLAEQRGQEKQGIAHLEKALDLEYQQLPEVIDLRSWRNDYGKLLDHYHKLAESAKTLNVAPLPDLKPRTVRAIDRWRGHDPEAAEACRKAADILALLGEKDLAWDYCTTTLLGHGLEASRWQNVAQELTQQGNYQLADQALAVAAEVEPDNAEVVWQRAKNLRQAKKTEEADKLMRRLAEEKWPERYQGIRAHAQEQMKK